MGEIEVNATLEPVQLAGQIVWKVFVGSVVTRHLSPPDEAVIDMAAARELCRRATEVQPLDFDMAIPPVWRDWWSERAPVERAAVWRGCRALWAVMTGPRW